MFYILLPTVPSSNDEVPVSLIHQQHLGNVWQHGNDLQQSEPLGFLLELPQCRLPTNHSRRIARFAEFSNEPIYLALVASLC